MLNAGHDVSVDSLPSYLPTQSSDNDYVSSLRNYSNDDPNLYARDLFQLASKKVVLPYSEKLVIASLIKSKCDEFNIHTSCHILWSIGTLRFPLRNKAVSYICDVILKKLNTDRGALNSSDMARALGGLARLGVKWKQTRPMGKEEKSFLNSLRYLMPHMTYIQISSSVWALGKIGITWSKLDVKNRRAISLSVQKTALSMDSRSVANTIHGLSNMKLKWNDLSPFLEEALLKAMTATAKYMTEQEVSNCLSGLGRMGTRWDSLPGTVRTKMMQRFSKVSKKESHRVENIIGQKGLSMSIHGLGRMSVAWKSLPVTFRRVLITALDRVLPLINAQEVSNILYGLGKMGVIWRSELSDATRSLLSEAVTREAWRLNPQGTANSVWGLQLMGVDWSRDLTGVVRAALWDSIRREVVRFDEQEVGNIIHALAKMNLIFGQIPLDIYSSLLQRLTSQLPLMLPQGIIMVLVGLSKLNVQWTGLPDSLRDRFISSSLQVIKGINSPELLNSMIYALSSIGLKWSSLSVQYPHLQCAILESIVRYHYKKANDNANDDYEDYEDHDGAGAGAGVDEIHSGKKNMESVSLLESLKSSNSKNLGQRERHNEESRGKQEGVAATSASSSSSSPTSTFPSFDVFSDDNKKSFNPSESLLQNLRDHGYEKFEKISTSSVSLSSLLENVKIQDDAEDVDPKKRIQSIRLLLNLTDVRVYDYGRKLSHSSRGSRGGNKAGSEYNPISIASARESIKSIKIKENQRTSSQFVGNKFRDSASEKSMKMVGAVRINKKRKGKKRKNVKRIEEEEEEEEEEGKEETEDRSYGGSMKKIESKQQKVNSSGDFKKTRDAVKSLKSSTGNDGSIAGFEITSSNSGPTSAIPELIYVLGLLGVPWSELNDEANLALSRGLVDVLSTLELSERSTVNTVYGLSSMNGKWKEFRPSLRSALLKQLIHISDSLGEQGVAVSILSLSKLEVCWEDDLSESTRELLLNCIYRQSHIGEHALASLLYGLAKLGTKFDDLHPQVLSTLKEAIVVCHVQDKCTPQGVANSLYGLARMSAKWSKLSSSVRMALTNEVIAVAPESDETQLSNIVWSLAKLETKWSELGCTDALISSLSRKIRSMNERHLTTVVYSLGLLGAEWQALPTSVSKGLINGLLRVGKSSTSSSSTHRPTTMKTWRATDQDLIEFAVSNTTSEFSTHGDIDAQGFSMTLHGLSKLGATWATLPSSFIDWQRESICKLTGEINFKQLASTVISLGKLGWRWEGLGEKQRRALLRPIPRLMSGADCGAIANLANGLGVMGATWSLMPKSVSNALSLGVIKVSRRGTSSELASALYGMALMECQWQKEFDSNFQAALIEGIIRVASDDNASPQAQANLMYSLSLLVFDIEDSKLQSLLSPAYVALLNCIERGGIGRFSEKEREQILLFIHLVRITTPCKEQADGVRPIFKVAKSKYDSVHGHDRSYLEESVITALSQLLAKRNKDLEVADEYSAFDGAFPVDGTIFEDHDYINPVGFIEVDGPHHYRNGRLRRKDMLKEMLYRRKHPLATFTRVSYDQVKTLGTEKVVFAVANFITLTHSHTESEKAMLQDDEIHAFTARNAERELKKLLGVPTLFRDRNEDMNRRNLAAQNDGGPDFDMQSLYSIFGDVGWSMEKRFFADV